MRYLGRRLFQVTFTIITSALLASCGSADGPSAPTPSGPKTFAIASGQTPIAGGPLLLPPIDFDATNHAALTATVGGVPTPLVVTQGGDLHVLLPLYLNPEELWFAPPSEPQDIVITANGAVVARSDEGVLIVAPPEAPDATAEALSDLTRRLDAFATWRGSFVAPAGRQDQHMFALIEGLREFLASEEAGSLRDMVANLTTEERRLGDALVAASGTRDAFSELADLAEDLPAENFSKRQADSGLCGIPFPDTELAAMMQFSAMAKEFASGYVSGVASDWSGFEASLAAFATITYLDKLPFVDGLGKALGIVNAYFALMDLIANKYVTALMPTVIESLTVTVSDPTLTAGETSESLKVICVRNDPPAFTLTDIVGQILNLVGIVADPPADVIARLENLGTIMLDRVNGFIGSYAADHPGISLDVELTSMPEISWTADIEDPDLLELMSADPAIARPLTDELEWKAPIGASGSTTIFCRPKTGPDARFVDDFLGVSYGGAAFGFDVIASNSVTISIDDLPSLALDFTGDDEDFYIDRTTSVRFRAGYIGDSATEWAAGIQVEITSATGCSFTQFSGTTDGNGYFDVDLTPFEEEFSFETLVTGAGGQDRDDEFGDYYAEPVAFDFIGGSASSTVSMESSACSPSCGQYGFFYNKYDHDSQYGPQMEGAASSLSESGSGSFDSIVLESPMTSMATASGDGSSAIMEGDDQVTLVLSATANATVEFQDNDPDEPPTYWRWNARSKGVGGASRSLFVRGWAVEVDISFTPPTKGSATLGPMGTWTHTSGFTSPDWNDTDDGVEWTGSFGPNKGFNFGISAIAEAAVEKGPDDAPGGGEDSQDSSGSLVVTLKLIPPSAMGLEAPNQGLVMRR